MQNRERQLVTLVREICETDGITLHSFCEEWVHRLEKDGRVGFVFGYDFGLNGAAANLIAKDKAATWAILSHAGVPAVEHRLFFSPSMAEYVPHDGNWTAMLAFLGAHPEGLVCKPNEGTGGSDVWRVATPLQLESAVHKLFQRSRALCLSPFVDGAAEFRVIVVDGVAEITYEKIRPAIVGDGHSTLRELVAQHPAAARILAASAAMREPLDNQLVPAPGEQVLVNWRHNLGQGSAAVLLPGDHPKRSALCQLARDAAAALRLRVASIDILEAGGTAAVLEVNAGIMMEQLAATEPAMRDLAKAVYRRMIHLMLD